MSLLKNIQGTVISDDKSQADDMRNSKSKKNVELVLHMVCTVNTPAKRVVIFH